MWTNPPLQTIKLIVCIFIPKMLRGSDCKLHLFGLCVVTLGFSFHSKGPLKALACRYLLRSAFLFVVLYFLCLENRSIAPLFIYGCLVARII